MRERCEDDEVTDGTERTAVTQPQKLPWTQLVLSTVVTAQGTDGYLCLGGHGGAYRPLLLTGSVTTDPFRGLPVRNDHHKKPFVNERARERVFSRPTMSRLCPCPALAPSEDEVLGVHVPVSPGNPHAKVPPVDRQPLRQS